MKFKLIFLIILFSHAFMLTKLTFFPYPEFFVNPYLVNNGFKPYKQIMDQHSPGLMFFPINFNNLGMTTPEIARYWLISIVLIIQIMLFIISAKILKSEKKALTVSLLYLIWQPFFEGTTFWIDSILPIFLLPAFYTSYKYIYENEAKYSLITVTGLLLGLAVVFKQVILPVAFLVMLLLFWQRRKFRTIYMFLIGFLLPVLLMVLYFWRIGVIKDFWYWGVVFNLTTFAKYGKKLAPSVGYYTRVALVFSMPMLALFSKNGKVVILTFIFLFGSLAGVFARFDFVHFQPALPFAVLATVIGFESIYQKKYLKWAILVYVLISIWWITVFYKGHLTEKVILYDRHINTLAGKIQGLVKPGEKIFILGAPLHLYQITQTMPAADLFYIQAPWYVMIAGDKTLAGVKKDDPKIVVVDRTVVFDGYQIADYAKEIDQYLMNNYHQIDQVGSIQIMYKNSP